MLNSVRSQETLKEFLEWKILRDIFSQEGFDNLCLNFTNILNLPFSN